MGREAVEYIIPIGRCLNMNLPDNILKQKLKNVYFIWGSGKTTSANELARRHSYYVYHTDDNRWTHFTNATPEFQPTMCRDVPDYFALDPEDARQWEHDIVREMTPMIVADLIELSTQHETVICEGDIDVEVIIPIATHMVYITNLGASYDFFDRPKQRHMLEEIRNRTDLTDKEKEQQIQNAYAIVGSGDRVIPAWVEEHAIKNIVRNDSTTVAQTVDAIEEYFELLPKITWYHGSPFELNELAAGSTVTTWKELAMAFSHKPTTLEYDFVGGNIRHNGNVSGILYVIDEPITKGRDIYEHPNTSMDIGVEWLTKRPMKLRKLGAVFANVAWTK